MPIRAGEVVTTYVTEYTGDTRDLERASNRARQLILQNEAAILRSQNALSRVNAITSGHDYGAKGARAAAASFGDLAGELGVVSRLGGGGGLGIFGGVAAGTFAAARAGVEYRQTLDKLSKSFTTLLGSQQAAARMMGDLQALSANTPFEFEGVARGTQRFLNMGMAAKDIIPTLTAVGNAVAAAGGGSEQIDRVSLALAQMTAKGKVSAEEMNQLAEAGVGGWRILEEQLGRSKGELMKMAEAGQISADTFVQAFRRAHEGGDAMKRQMETLSGATSTLTDNTKMLLAVAFDPLHSALRDITVELAKTTTEGFNLSRAFDSAAGAAVSLMKLNPSAATTWHVLGLNKIQIPTGSLVADAFTGAAAKMHAENDQLTKQAKDAADSMNATLLQALKDGGAKRERVIKTDLDRLREFVKEWDFLVTSTTGGRHNRGSLHYAGRAADVSVHGKSDQEIRAFMEAARSAGFGVRDERTRPVGQKVWGGPHLHLEALSKAAQAAARDAQGEWSRVASEMERASEAGFDAFIRGEEERRAATAELGKRVREEIEGQTRLLLGEQTELEKVNALLSDPKALKGADERSAALLRELALVNDLSRHYEDFLSRDLPTPGPLGAYSPEPEAGPVVLGSGEAPRNIYADRVRAREQHLQIADDITDIYRSTFDRIGEGWEGMWDEMLNVARHTLLSISSEMIRAMLTGEKSGAGGIVGFFTNHILGAVLGSAFGGGAAVGGAGSGAGSLLSGMIPAHAAGTFSASPGFALVGEKGPELVRMRGGERVYNNRESKQILAGGNQTVNHYHINVPPPPPRSYSQPRSRRELADALAGAFKGRV